MWNLVKDGGELGQPSVNKRFQNKNRGSKLEGREKGGEGGREGASEWVAWGNGFGVGLDFRWDDVDCFSLTICRAGDECI